MPVNLQFNYVLLHGDKQRQETIQLGASIACAHLVLLIVFNLLYFLADCTTNGRAYVAVLSTVRLSSTSNISETVGDRGFSSR